jgi:LPXTG-motif cell wall-anchored protein
VAPAETTDLPTAPEASEAPAPEPAATAAVADTRAAAVSGPPTVTVSPTSGLNPAGGSTITVSGSGFDPDKNNKFGVYAVFGPVDPGTYFEDAGRFLAAKWLHTGGGASGSPGQGELNADGTFSATLPPTGAAPLTASYVDGNGTSVNCMVTQCYVVTMAAHGVSDRSMDTCTAVSFSGGTATPTVDRRCQPIATPTGQPTGAGSPTGSDGSGTGSAGGSGGSNGGGSGGGGASSTLPRTGSNGPGLALVGLAALLSGLGIVQGNRRWRVKTRPVAVGGPPDSTG